MQPLDRQFNIAVNHIANQLFPNGFDISDDPDATPSSLRKLTQHIDATGRMMVRGGASENTVFADRETNHAFRAWHDWHHYKHRLPFDIEGERKALEHQVADIRKLYGDGTASRRMVALLEAEIIGQVLHYEEFGVYPKDQRAFATAYLTSCWRCGGPF